MMRRAMPLAVLLAVSSIVAALAVTAPVALAQAPAAGLAPPIHPVPPVPSIVRAELERRLRAGVDATTWDDGGDLSRFAYLHATEIFPAAIIARGGPIRTLPERLRPEIGRYPLDDDEKRRTLERFIDDELDGFVILHRGAVVYERYPRMRPDERHLSFSVSKAFVGAALAILEDRGRIDLSKSIAAYVPRLKGTAWEAASVRDLADMAAGMEGAESSTAAYSDPKHKHYLMEAALGWQPRTPDMPESVRKGDSFAFVATLARVVPPGTQRAYASLQTHVLAEAIEHVTGQRLADVLGDLLWSRAGAEGDAAILVNERGEPIAHGGICLRLRDLARFGLLFTATGAKDARPVIAPAILKRFDTTGRPELLRKGHPEWIHHANYQWDAVGTKGELTKGGFGGQLLYIDRERDVVVAYFGTNTTLDKEAPPLPLRTLLARYFDAAN